MPEQVKKDVPKAKIELVRRGLVLYTWGNVSGKDGESPYGGAIGP